MFLYIITFFAVDDIGEVNEMSLQSMMSLYLNILVGAVMSVFIKLFNKKFSCKSLYFENRTESKIFDKTLFFSIGMMMKFQIQ